MAEGSSAFSLFSTQWSDNSIHITDKQPDQEEMDRVNMQLYDMFVDCIDPCVIQEVAVSRNWNINEAINDLVTLTSSDCRKQNSQEECLCGNTNQNVVQSLPKGNNGVCKNGKKKLNLEPVHSRPNLLSGFPDLIDLNPQPKLNDIKISYNREPDEDDDADVIILKGNEFLLTGIEEKPVSQQSSPSSSASMASVRPQCFVQLMPELLSNNKKFETKTVKKPVVQKEKQKKNLVKKDVSLHNQYGYITRQPDPLKRVVMLIDKNIKVMVLMRGCPGSGKTHLSKLVLQKAKIKSDLYSKFIFSADNYFLKRGVYVFNPEHLGDAHAWVQKRVITAAEESRNPIIIDNTNTQMWEMKSYASIGVKYGYHLEILEPNTPWAFKERELSKKNVHDVPKSKIRSMLERYERDITPAKLMLQLNLYYVRGNEPPQLCIKRPVKQVKSGKNKNPTKKTEKLLKNESVLHVPSQLTEASKSSTKKSLDYMSILDFIAVPELKTLIENIDKQRGEISETCSSDKINNNENVISEAASNYMFMYNSFEVASDNKEEVTSSSDNQSLSENESLIVDESVQDSTIVSTEITCTNENYNSNLINGSNDLILFADSNNMCKSERKEENVLNISGIFEDNFFSDFVRKSVSGSDTTNDNLLSDICDLPACDEAALRKHVHSVDEIDYDCISFTDDNRCGNETNFMFETNSVSSTDETEHTTRSCTSYSFTAESLAKHIHEVQDNNYCNAVVEYKNSSVDLVKLWNEWHQEKENAAVNSDCMLNIEATCAGNSQSLHEALNENLVLSVVPVDDNSHANQLGVVEEENDDTCTAHNGVISEIERKHPDFSSVLLLQCEECECLSYNQESHKQDVTLEKNSCLCQAKIVDKIANFAHVLSSEDLIQQNKNEKLVDNLFTHNSDSPDNNLIHKGIQFFDNRIVKTLDIINFDTESNKIVNANQSESQKITEGTVNINENLRETKSECYNDIKINVEDSGLNSAVQKIDCKTFNTADERQCGDLDENYNDNQTKYKGINNANSDSLCCVKSDFCKESGNTIELEENENVSQQSLEEFIESNKVLLCGTSSDTTGSSNDVSYKNNSIFKESIKKDEIEINCVSVNDSDTSSDCKISLIQYLLEKQAENNDHSDKNDSSILIVNQPDSPNLSSSFDKDCQFIPSEDSEDFVDPELDGSLIQNFDLLAFLSGKKVKEDAVDMTVDKNVYESRHDCKESLHTVNLDENIYEKSETAVEDSGLKEWETQGGSWDESDKKVTEKDVDTTTPKPARSNTKTRIRNACGSPINLIENLPDSCDWDTIDNPSFNWNSPDTVYKIENPTETKPQRQRDCKQKASVADQSTNTCYTDFNLLHHDSSDETIKETILFSKNRNICEGRTPNTDVCKPNVMFDKSTMTGDDLGFETKLKYDFQQLVEMFPETELGSLMELVDKCNGDLDWAADVLADSAERNTLLTLSNSFCNTADVPLGTYDPPQDSSFVQANVPVAEELFLDPPSQCATLKKSTKQEKKYVSESQLELKKLIENSFVLDKSHYSEHVWKIKKKKNGDYTKRDNGSEREDDGYYPFLQDPEDSEFLNIKSDIEDETSEDEDESEDKIDNIEDTEDDDLEEDTSETEEEEEEEEEEQLFDAETDDEEETVKLTFDWNFIMQLQKTFGNPLPDMKDLKPEIDLPLSLARQVHSYVVESLIHQIEQQQEILDQMIADDNAFARQLQQQEEEKASTSAQQPVPQLQEIMDMEMALALYRADLDDWKQQSQDSVANRLSKKLLLEKFPQVDCNVLMEMFHAHNCSLHDTVATLSMSLSVDEPGLVQREMELLANAKEEKDKIQKSKETTVFSYVPTDENTQRMMALKKEAGDMRLQASRYYELRTECFTKAQNMYRSGNKAVASYYSHLAESYKEKIELCNSQAAACLLYARTSSQTLDLHFLRVAEAEEVLKLFLDESIAQMREKQKTRAVLYLITGRGLHSADGISRIKGMVIYRLKQRKIKFSEVNPGMVRAVITKNTQLSYK